MRLSRSSKTHPITESDRVVVTTHDGGHHGGDEGEPANPRLWHAITIQARAKFAKYPSPAASSWVHRQYILKGGQFRSPKKHKK